ncbi:MAG: pyruvate formate lyase family protein [Eubacteriales bacterium]
MSGCVRSLKLNEPKMRTVQSLCVGGVHEGENGANELTKLCLEVMTFLAMPYPNMSARLNPKTRSGFMKRLFVQ